MSLGLLRCFHGWLYADFNRGALDVAAFDSINAFISILLSSPSGSPMRHSPGGLNFGIQVGIRSGRQLRTGLGSARPV